MTKAIQLAGLFTSATQTGAEIHAALMAKPATAKLEPHLAQAGNKSVPDTRLLVCSSFTVLVDVREYLHDDMTVIVSDSPLMLACLTTATPLDYSNKISYKFIFSPPQYSLLLPALTGKAKKVQLLADSFDVVGLITADSLSGGLILTELNRVQSYFDALARNRLRFLLMQALQVKEVKPVLVEMRDFLKAECRQGTHRADAITFFKKLVQGGALATLRKCVAELDAKRALQSVAKKYGVEEFELNYLRKMFRNLDKAAARTTAYATRLKTMKA